MIFIADRRSLAQDIQDARGSGARLEPVCAVADIEARTLNPKRNSVILEHATGNYGKQLAA
jgi:hypothetical protein